MTVIKISKKKKNFLNSLKIVCTQVALTYDDIMSAGLHVDDMPVKTFFFRLIIYLFIHLVMYLFIFMFCYVDTPRNVYKKRNNN